MTNVVTETVGRTLVVTINRPDVLNAVDGPTATELYDTFTAFDADDALDVAVLQGAEGAFCAGADLKAIADARGNPMTQPQPADIVDSMGPMGPTRMLLSKPVIAAVEGHAVAGGLELACWCDLRVAARDATFGVYCRRWGVPLVDGGTIRLPRLIGHSQAMDMILTAKAVSGEEGLAIGLVNRVAEPGEALTVALELAETIGAFPQVCMRSDRRSAIDQWSLDLGDALHREITLGTTVVRSGETQAGAARFTQRDRS